MVELYLAYFLIMKGNEPVGSLQSGELVTIEVCTDILNAHDDYEAQIHAGGAPDDFSLDQGHCDLHQPGRGA